MEKEQSWSNYGVIMEKMSNEQELNNTYFNPNYENSNDPFESTLSSIVSSPSTTLSNGCGDKLMIKELIGRLGSISDSFGQIINSPPLSKFDLSSLMISGNNYPINADPGFVERAAKYSCFGNSSSFNKNVRDMSIYRRDDNNNNGDSRESSSICEQKPSSYKPRNGANYRTRKSISKAQCASSIIDDKVGKENEESDAKRRKVENKEVNKKENGEECNSSKVKKNNNNDNDNDNNNNNDNKEAEKAEPPKDYIHVRARRGQATDSHSLAERVRREKISERMKFLQGLVPGCNKVTGKATVLDEIINYVQSLQRQVEFLSMKLSTMNPRMEFNMEALLSKDMFRSRLPSLPQTMYSLLDQNSAQEFPLVYQSTHQMPLPFPNEIENPFSVSPMNMSEVQRNPNVPLPSIDGFVDSLTQLPTLWEDDLQSIVQMGNFPNQTQSVPGTIQLKRYSYRRVATYELFALSLRNTSTYNMSVFYRYIAE